MAVRGQPSGVAPGACTDIEDEAGPVRQGADQPAVDLLERHALVPGVEALCSVPGYARRIEQSRRHIRLEDGPGHIDISVYDKLKPGTGSLSSVCGGAAGASLRDAKSGLLQAVSDAAKKADSQGPR